MILEGGLILMLNFDAAIFRTLDEGGAEFKIAMKQCLRLFLMMLDFDAWWYLRVGGVQIGDALFKIAIKQYLGRLMIL